MKEKLFAVAEALTGEEIRAVRNRLGLTQREFAELVNISVKSVERWETGDAPITGPITTLVKILWEGPELAKNFRIPEKTYPMRLWYMYKSEICTVIDVDEVRRRVKIRNFTGLDQFRAFGCVEEPTFDDYEAFLESRCMPRSRDKMKWVLKELDLPFYDPLMIVEKTGGRMAEDEFWVRIER